MDSLGPNEDRSRFGYAAHNIEIREARYFAMSIVGVMLGIEDGSTLSRSSPSFLLGSNVFIADRNRNGWTGVAIGLAIGARVSPGAALVCAILGGLIGDSIRERLF